MVQASLLTTSSISCLIQDMQQQLTPRGRHPVPPQEPKRPDVGSGPRGHQINASGKKRFQVVHEFKIGIKIFAARLEAH